MCETILLLPNESLLDHPVADIYTEKWRPFLVTRRRRADVPMTGLVLSIPFPRPLATSWYSLTNGTRTYFLRISRKPDTVEEIACISDAYFVGQPDYLQV